MRSNAGRRWTARRAVAATAVVVGMITTLGLTSMVGPAAGASAKIDGQNRIHFAVYKGYHSTGELDCNDFSTVQHSVRGPMNCTDIRGSSETSTANTWGGKFYDNGHYIGHDEPDNTFLSDHAGSGGNVSWTITLGTDPGAQPTDKTPGKDISHWFELTPAPWLSMAICDGNSYPQLPCTPNSNANRAASRYPGGGSAFEEMQFYPPGNSPFVDSESCNSSQWCAALTIDSLECTAGFVQCNPACEEPVNFSFVQRNGVPSGPPSPQEANDATFTPNGQTLLMNPGDKLRVHLWDAPVPGHQGQRALEVTIDDLTTGQSGSMQASAANGFQNTSIVNCAGTPFNFEPEYNTASPGNYVPWAALQTDISTEFETGHWEACTSLSDEITNPFDPSDIGGTYNGCSGPYESAGGDEGAETGDAVCYYAGDTHEGYDGPNTYAQPDMTTGCQDDVYQNGDLDFDGSPYWTEWPTSLTAGTYPGSFYESVPTSRGTIYDRHFFQTDVALSESACTAQAQSKCTVPPDGPGHFYPYWSMADCHLEFGNVSKGVVDFNKDHQYGTVQWKKLGYPEFEGPIEHNSCR